jgi:transposase
MKFFAALPPCLVGLEACATAHHWARELTKLGHEVGLMPAKDVKAYVKRNKNDAADAEAICEAVRRPTMRFVHPKSAEQQGRLMQHRARDLLLRQQTQVINALRAHLAELGMFQRFAQFKELYFHGSPLYLLQRIAYRSMSFSISPALYAGMLSASASKVVLSVMAHSSRFPGHS